MKLTFVSNYINHHQIPFSDACCRELDGEYYFIQTQPMEEERIAMGWDREAGRLPYVREMDKEEALCRKLILESDIAIFGWSGREDLMDELIRRRLEAGRPVLRVSERLYREGQWRAVSPRGLLKKYRQHTRYRKQPMCLLCAGAYVASDFHIIRAYPEKMLRFGYFPETRHYTDEQLREMKEKDGRVHILWAGRFLPLKHPEFAVRIGEELKREQRDFHIHMAGGGELEAELREQVESRGLQEYVTFYGYTAPGEVRRMMEKCHIHLFTSNHLEGWGAVVNEAMNSGCAVVASGEAGAVPFLLRHGENGLIYRRDSYEEFAGLVKRLAADRELTAGLGREAYRTIVDLWNAEHAAAELIRFCRGLLEGRIVPAGEGPLSRAPIIVPGRY